MATIRLEATGYERHDVFEAHGRVLEGGRVDNTQEQVASEVQAILTNAETRHDRFTRRFESLRQQLAEAQDTTRIEQEIEGIRLLMTRLEEQIERLRRRLIR